MVDDKGHILGLTVSPLDGMCQAVDSRPGCCARRTLIAQNSQCVKGRTTTLITNNRCHLSVLVLVVSVFVLSGCGQRRALFEHELKGLGMQYHSYYAEYGRAPANAEELRQFKPPFGDLGELSMAWNAIESGEFKLVWNALLDKNTNENEKYVLGFERQTAERGGLVMMGDCSLRQVTAEQFNAMTIIPSAK